MSEASRRLADAIFRALSDGGLIDYVMEEEIVEVIETTIEAELEYEGKGD